MKNMGKKNTETLKLKDSVGIFLLLAHFKWLKGTATFAINDYISNCQLSTLTTTTHTETHTHSNF